MHSFLETVKLKVSRRNESIVDKTGLIYSDLKNLYKRNNKLSFDCKNSLLKIREFLATLNFSFNFLIASKLSLTTKIFFLKPPIGKMYGNLIERAASEHFFFFITGRSVEEFGREFEFKTSSTRCSAIKLFEVSV